MMIDQKKVTLMGDFGIHYAAFTKTRTFGFECETFENETLKNKIHYTIDVRCVQNELENCVFEVSRKQIYINNQEPDLMIEQIADKLAQVIFPVQLKINRNGIIEEIANIDAIKKRWIVKKAEMISYYEGEIVEGIIKKTEKIILNPFALKLSICNNWFFHLYFKPLYVNYKIQQKFIWKSPIFGHHSLEYGVIHTVEEIHSETNKIYINAKGVSLDERSLNDVMNGIYPPAIAQEDKTVEKVESNMQVQYKLYGEDRSIFSIIGTFKTKIASNRYQTHKIGIYHLAESRDYRPINSIGLR